MLAWTEQIQRKGLSEQPNHIRVAIKSYDIKLVIGTTLAEGEVMAM